MTTIRWGTAPWGSYALTVIRASQREVVDSVKLQQGAGLSSTRLIVRDGVVWDLTVRDDTRLGKADLRTGSSVNIFDYAGLLTGNATAASGFQTPDVDTGAVYAATVVESSYEAGMKEDGKRTITVERLTLIEGS